MSYFGFALASGMFSGDCLISRKILELEKAKDFLGQENLVSCLNPSHEATIKILEPKFGIIVKIPESPPKVVLGNGDKILVMGIQGLPRGRGEYTDEEVASATFEWVLYTVSE